MTRIVLVCLLALARTASLAAQQPIPLDTLRAGAGSRAIAGAAVATRSVDILTRAEIEALPARTIAAVLARGLGVDLQARSPAQADVSIRGSSFEQVLVLVDGVPVNDDQTGHFHLDTAVPLDAIERIEILRGPAAALYGSAAIGGVINIVTRRGAPELSARVQGGSHGSYAGGVELATARLRGPAARLSVEHDRSDGHRAGVDHEITQARIALDVPVQGGTLRADAGYALRDFGADGFYAPYASYEETRAATASVSYQRGLGGISVQPRVSLREHDDDFILVRTNPALYRNLHTTRQLAGEVVARTSFNEMLVAIGAEVVRSDIDSRSANPGRQALGNRTEDRVALFGEVGAGAVASGLVTAGVRLDHHSTFGTFLSPSLAASYRLNSHLRLRGAGGTGFRVPNWTERYYEDPANIGNPDLEAERFWTAELGLMVTPSAAVRVDVAAFVRQADDLIDWGRPDGAAPTAVWRTMNVESATFRGLEATARASQVGPLTLTARAALLAVDAEEVDGMTSKYALRPLTRALSLDALLPLLPGTSFSVRASDYNRAGEDGDAWRLLDARLAAHIRGVQLFADATNLLDEEYLDVSARPAPRRAFAVGMRIRR
ncbi:MAG TPA: TonB-dependent receptor [Longimicrobiales bacterium]|nr:TonB-dependent receptor [Longimicrobiales bacterium]